MVDPVQGASVQSSAQLKTEGTVTSSVTASQDATSTAAPAPAPTPAPTKTAEKAAEVAGKVIESEGDSATHTGNQTATPNVNQTATSVEPSIFQRAFSSVGGFVSGARDSVVGAAASARQSAGDAIRAAAHFVSYDNLNEMGDNAINYVLTSSPVTKSQELLNNGIGFIGDNAPTPSNWLPVSVAAGCVFASIKTIQAGLNNVSLGNHKRAVCQFFVGASAAILAGSIAYQTPAGQAARARVIG